MAAEDVTRPSDRRELSRWDRIWPRVLALLQAALGAWGFASQILADGDRPYLLAFSVVLVSGAPATARIITAWLEAKPPR